MATISNWIIDGGEFSVQSELYLEVTSPGQMIYRGRSLQRLKTNDKTNDANYAFVVWLRPQSGLKFQIRGRYVDNHNFVFLDIDMENNVVKLGGYEDGNELIQTSVIHNFIETDKCSCELWVFGEDIYCIINDVIILENTLNYHTNQHGFSLNVVALEDKAIFNKIAVHELLDQPARATLPFNLITDNRDFLKDLIEADIISFEDFRNKYRAWERGKDIGNSDLTWHSLGRRIQKPSTEKMPPP